MTLDAHEVMNVKSTFEDYKVIWINDLEKLSELLSETRDPYLLIDRNIYQIYGESIEASLLAPKFIVDASEDSKQLKTIENICAWLMEKGATKTSTLIAFGGGVIQDLATFVSHIYYRGIRWVYFPTTVLAMADSCIGAKCALNLAGHKNQLGVIHAPSLVVIFRDFIGTLPEPEISSGLGEILKLSVTGSGEFFEEFLEKATDPSLLDELIVASLRSKKVIIELDELEGNLRRILNYGHSFGHAIESLSEHKVTHGEAILFGMDLINFLGTRWNVTKPEFESKFRETLVKIFPNVSIPSDITASALVDELKRDKKMAHGKMVFAVPVEIGEITLVTKELDEILIDQVEMYIENVWRPTFN